MTLSAADMAKFMEFQRFCKAVCLSDFTPSRASTAQAKVLQRSQKINAQLLAAEYPDFPHAFRLTYPSKAYLLDSVLKGTQPNAIS